MKTTSLLAMLRTPPCPIVLMPVLVLVALASVFASASAAETPKLLWQIGKPDNDDREFVLAPNHYDQFRDDGYFVVGKSDPLHDRPYVHPGPADGWAGGRADTFTIVFGLLRAPQVGECQLQLDLVDTQKGVPPTLEHSNQRPRVPQGTSPGAGDASVFGDPAKGRGTRSIFPSPPNSSRPV